MRVEHEGSYAAVGSVGGGPKNPVWVYNLRANPRVVVQDGLNTFELTARELAAPSARRGGSGRSPPTRPMRSTRRRPIG